MNGRVPNDGGILYDENASDEEDLIEVPDAAAPAPILDWAETSAIPDIFMTALT